MSKVYLMVKKYKHSIFTLVCLFFIEVVYGQAQVNMSDYLSQRFLRYVKTVPREEIYVHSDRDDYISGEDIWFNVYLIDRQTFKPSVTSRIVYFELLNNKNRPVVQKRVLIDNGSGPGQIVLPDTLSTGTYKIRAYTSWMKNFLPYNCFVKNISVYNALSHKDLKVVPQSSIRNKNITSQLITTPGVSLRVNNSKTDVLDLNLTTDDKFRTANNNICYLFIQTHGNINRVSAEKIKDTTTTITVSKSLLSSGVNQITIFNSKGEPVCERFIYTPEKKSEFISINSADSSKLRSKINVEVGTSTPLSLSSLTNLSISVAPVATEGVDDIDDYLIFGTEFGLPGETILNTQKQASQMIDSVLLDVRSNWIDWKQVLSANPPHFDFPFEKEDHYILGKLRGDQKVDNAQNYLLLCTPGKEATFQYAKTDKNGNFSFKVNIDEEMKDLIFVPADIIKDHVIEIASPFSDQYLHAAENVDSSSERIPDYISKLSVNHQVQKIYDTPSTGAPLSPVLKPVNRLRFYGKPDFELVLADFIKLPTMTEVIFELMPGVSLKKKRVGYEISITYHVMDNQYTTYPCLMIDGVVINDASLIVGLDPEYVEKIDVVREEYLVGKYHFHGLINVITKTADFSNVTLPDYMIRMPYKVVSQVSQFVSPDYTSTDKKESHIPDYRNTLYWNPSVKLNKDGKAGIEFWTSDNKSDYVVNVQGITAEGKTVSLKKIIRVK
jgi:hypothetical protein